MVPVSSPVEELTIELDLRDGRWHIHAGPASAIVRAWTWGERRRLVALATAGGAIDRTLFTRGLLDLVLDGALPSLPPSVLAFVCLYLLGVPENGRIIPFARAELLAAKTFGWLPQHLDAQPAGDIDRLIAQLEPIADPEDGWTHIVVVPDEESSIEGRLESMLRTLARLAGLGEATAEVLVPPPPPHAWQAPPDAVATSQPDQSFEPTFRGTARLHRSATSNGSTMGRVDEPAGEGSTPPVPPRPRIARLASRLLTRAGSTVAPPAWPSDHEIRAGITGMPTGQASGTPDVRSVRAIDHDIAAPRMPRLDAPEASSSPAQRPSAYSGASGHVQAQGTLKAIPAATGHSGLRASADVAAERREARRPPAPVEDGDFLPTFRATVHWPDIARTPGDAGARPSAASLPHHPFERSELEERLADVLDRAAREAGIDVP